jgi:hypothetical protein
MGAFEAKAVLAGFDDMRLVRDAVDQRFAETCVGNDFGPYRKGHLIVRMTVAFSARSAMTWNRYSAPTSAIRTEPTSSILTEYSISSNCARNNFSGAINGRPLLAYISSKLADSFAKAISAISRIARNGWFLTRVSGERCVCCQVFCHVGAKRPTNG